MAHEDHCPTMIGGETFSSSAKILKYMYIYVYVPFSALQTWQGFVGDWDDYNWYVEDKGYSDTGSSCRGDLFTTTANWPKNTYWYSSGAMACSIM